MNDRRRNAKEKEKIKMAILTAECDRAFVVAADKAEQFKQQKKNVKVFKQIENVTTKLNKTIKVDAK